tara:strand:+ start:2000 stop:2176 length:177 start_codon:yes stop_codon:yes gene_type:complete
MFQPTGWPPSPWQSGVAVRAVGCEIVSTCGAYEPLLVRIGVQNGTIAALTKYLFKYLF